MACITYKEFTDACLEFITISQKLGDSWKANGDVEVEGSFFLSKKQCISKVPKIEDDIANILQQMEGLEVETENHHELSEPYDPSSLGNAPQNDFVICEYHIVYSLSHSVPTLYFSACYASGSSLKLEEVWDRVPSLFSEQILNKKWESLTQVEHPVLGSPFFQLHPCNTMILMSKLKGKDENSSKLQGWKYIASWLSMFGPIVGLDISLSYFTT